jgi:hypothetical protein
MPWRRSPSQFDRSLAGAVRHRRRRCSHRGRRGSPICFDFGDQRAARLHGQDGCRGSRRVLRSAPGCREPANTCSPARAGAAEEAGRAAEESRAARRSVAIAAARRIARSQERAPRKGTRCGGSAADWAARRAEEAPDEPDQGGCRRGDGWSSRRCLRVGAARVDVRPGRHALGSLPPASQFLTAPRGR